MCPGPRLKRTFTLLKATLNRVQVLFSIRGTKRLVPFPARMRFWRDTGHILPGLCTCQNRTGALRDHAAGRTATPGRMRAKGTAAQLQAGKQQGFGPVGVSRHFCRRSYLSVTKLSGVRRNFGTQGGQKWLHRFCAIRFDNCSFNWLYG